MKAVHDDHKPCPPAVHAAEGACIRGGVRRRPGKHLAERVGDAPMSVEDLSAAVTTEPQPLRRLLRSLSCYGVFTENQDGTFAHTDMSRLLREDDPNSLRHISLWCTEPWTWSVWPQLDEAVRSGRNVFEDMYDREFFSYLNEEAPESAYVFNDFRCLAEAQRG